MLLFSSTIRLSLQAQIVKPKTLFQHAKKSTSSGGLCLTRSITADSKKNNIFISLLKTNNSSASTGTRRIAPKKRFMTTQKKKEAGGKKRMSYWEWWTQPVRMPRPKYSGKWFMEITLLSTVFAITGTSTMVLVRPAVSEVLGIRGSLKEGPWSYRLCSVVIMTPLYSLMLVFVGTVFGRHHYFRHFAVKMFSRFGIDPKLMDKNFHETAKSFQKW